MIRVLTCDPETSSPAQQETLGWIGCGFDSLRDFAEQFGPRPFSEISIGLAIRGTIARPADTQNMNPGRDGFETVTPL